MNRAIRILIETTNHCLLSAGVICQILTISICEKQHCCNVACQLWFIERKPWMYFTRIEEWCLAFWLLVQNASRACFSCFMLHTKYISAWILWSFYLFPRYLVNTTNFFLKKTSFLLSLRAILLTFLILNVRQNSFILQQSSKNSRLMLTLIEIPIAFVN